jgi:hypothetical protein
MRRYVAIAILGALATAIHGQGRKPDLDTRFLTRPDPSERRSGTIRSPRPIFYESPVSARLERIDPIECSWDQQVTYDVELRNIARQEITLPWSVFPPSSQPREEFATVFPIMTISLAVGDGMEGYLGSVEVLQGSLDEPGSVRRLAPGASVMIRASTPCQFRNSKAGPMIAPTGTIAVRVFARVQVKRTTDELGAFTNSNELPVTVSR